MRVQHGYSNLLRGLTNYLSRGQLLVLSACLSLGLVLLGNSALSQPNSIEAVSETAPTNAAV